MSIAAVDIEIGRPNEPETPWERLDVVVDPNRQHMVIAADVLERLGIRRGEPQSFAVGNGEYLRRSVGFVAIRVGDRIGCANAIFGEAGDANLLGATTLESLGLALDPLRRELVDLPMTL